MKSRPAENTAIFSIERSNLGAQNLIFNRIREDSEDLFFGVFQFILRSLSRFVMLFFVRLKVRGKDNARKTRQPVILIANHKSYFDPLMIAGSLPLFSHIFPLRFIAKDQFFKHFFSRLAYKAMASYPTFQGQGLDKSLEMPIRILSGGGTVVFFPEGRTVREEGLGQGRIGLAVLARSVPNAQILPMAIHGSYKISHLGWFRRADVRTIVGDPFYLRDKLDLKTATLQSITDFFMQIIGELYDEIRFD